MLNCDQFYNYLLKSGIHYFAGVPDSLLKNICAFISDHSTKDNHVIAANEGGAIGLATGYYLATQKPALVYMQNSGFGNIINPLLSIADPDVYGIPMLLLIGWRGEPGVKDEPQHKKQGRVNEAMLKSMEIPYQILGDDMVESKKMIDEALRVIKEKKCAYAFLVRKNTFSEYKINQQSPNNYNMKRETAIQTILEKLGDLDIVVSTTGKTSREVFEYRTKHGQSHKRDFLTIGGMGHCSQIAMGIAQQIKNRSVFIFDGDGASIMHLGAQAIIGDFGLSNLKHVVINNGAHDSVGGQPTVGFNLDFGGIAKSCGYKSAYSVHSLESLVHIFPEFYESEGPALLEVKVKMGARADLGRPTITPEKNKENFIGFLKDIV